MGEIVIDDMLSYDWDEDIINYWEDQLEKKGFINPKIFYNGFYSQGDGACFDFEGIDIFKFFPKKYLKLKNAINKNKVDLLIKSCRNNFANHYNHERTRFTTFDENYDTESLSNKEILKLREIINEIIKEVELKRLTYSVEIYDDLQTHFEELGELLANNKE